MSVDIYNGYGKKFLKGSDKSHEGFTSYNDLLIFYLKRKDNNSK